MSKSKTTPDVAIDPSKYKKFLDGFQETTIVNREVEVGSIITWHCGRIEGEGKSGKAKVHSARKTATENFEICFCIHGPLDDENLT